MAKIGIGIPTYNRKEELRSALECLRAQDRVDFIAMITDNASSDGTEDVVEEVVGNDSRFTYVRHGEGIPVKDNFLYSLRNLKTRYFLWRADDDLSSQDYIYRLSALLDQYEWADVAVSSLTQLRGQGHQSMPLSPIPEGNWEARAIHLLTACKPSWFYGVWRRDVLLHQYTKAYENYPFVWAWDHAVLLPSVMGGRVVGDRAAVFYQRLQEGQASYLLEPSEQFKARDLYARYADTILSELQPMRESEAEYQTALRFHIDKRVGGLWKLRRRAMKKYLRQFLRLV